MLKLNCKNSDYRIIGEENGLNLEEEFNNYSERIAEIIKSLNQRKDKPGECLQWMNLGYNEETAWYVKEFASMVEGRFENIIVLGIGGSALGGLAVTEALLKPYWNILSSEQRNNLPRIFFLDNIDPDSMNSLLEALDLKKTLVNVITKSGDTTETMAQFMVIKDTMQKVLGDDYRKNIIATTDKKMGILRQLADQEGYKIFYVPDDISSRFSVFSSVGLVPFALVGLDIDKIINGIKDIDLELKNTDIHQNIAAQFALIHYLMDTKKGKNITVLQLFNEGPNDKVITFIRTNEFNTTLEIPKIFEYTGVGYLGGKTVNDLINAEADSTTVSLSDNNRPTLTLTIDRIDEYNIAQLLYMLEVQTAIAGELYNINTFDQPGVENVKNYIYALMGRPGFDGSAAYLHDKLNTEINL